MAPKAQDLANYLEKKYGGINSIPDSEFEAVNAFKKSGGDDSQLSDEQFEILNAVYKEMTAAAPETPATEQMASNYLIEGPKPFEYKIEDQGITYTFKSNRLLEDADKAALAKDYQFSAPNYSEPAVTADPEVLAQWTAAQGGSDLAIEATAVAPRYTRVDATAPDAYGRKAAALAGDALSAPGRVIAAAGGELIDEYTSDSEDFASRLGRVHSREGQNIVGGITEDLLRDPSLPLMFMGGGAITGLRAKGVAEPLMYRTGPYNLAATEAVATPIKKTAAGMGLGAAGIAATDAMNDYALGENRVGPLDYALGTAGGALVAPVAKSTKSTLKNIFGTPENVSRIEIVPEVRAGDRLTDLMPALKGESAQLGLLEETLNTPTKTPNFFLAALKGKIRNVDARAESLIGELADAKLFRGEAIESLTRNAPTPEEVVRVGPHQVSDLIPSTPSAPQAPAGRLEAMLDYTFKHYPQYVQKGLDVTVNPAVAPINAVQGARRALQNWGEEGSQNFLANALGLKLPMGPNAVIQNVEDRLPQDSLPRYLQLKGGE
jgi:hypothetical protein